MNDITIRRPIEWVSHSATDVGTVRLENEDAVLAQPEIGLWVVADGMGGHEAGKVASNMIVESLGEINKPEHISEYVSEIENRIADVNHFERQLEEEADRIIAGTLREYGEADMALLYETNRVEFHRLSDAGRKGSFGPAETENARASAVIRSRQVRRSSLGVITGRLTSYWTRLAHTLSGR